MNSSSIEPGTEDKAPIRVALELDPNVWVPVGTIEVEALQSFLHDFEERP